MASDDYEPNTRQPRDTDWFRDARWGVFMHFLTDATTTADAWDRIVDGFDVEAFRDKGIGHVAATV